MAQFRKDTQQYLGDSKTIYEVGMIAVSNGQVVSSLHPLPVTLGSENITITGNVNVSDVVQVNSSPETPVHVHITEIGNSGLLQDQNIKYMPISGNTFIFNSNGIAITNSAPLSVYVTSNVVAQINNFPQTQNVSFSNQSVIVSGNVAGITANVVVSVNNFPTSMNANLYFSNGTAVTNSTPIPVVFNETLPELYSFNNFGIISHRGWTMSDTLIPMFSVRAKSTATKIVRIINYDIGNNNANQSTVGYVWIEDASISGTVPSWTSLNTQAEYRFYTDAYGSNTPNGFTGGINRHAGIIIGKNSSAEADIADIDLIANGKTMTLCVVRLDSATKLDLWVAADLAIYS